MTFLVSFVYYMIIFFMLYLQIQQITKILNSHMDSLQWIDQNSSKK